MRRVLSLLLTVAMMLSLVVVAGAAESGKVDLVIEPQSEMQDGYVLFDIYLEPGAGVDKIGAFQFSVTGKNCTIADVAYIDKTLKYDSENGTGYFQRYGGTPIASIRNNTYTFLAAGTSEKAHSYTDEDGNTIQMPKHIWDTNLVKTKIVTLKVLMNDGAANCSLTVDTTAGSSGRFTVGKSVQDPTTGKYSVQEAFTGVATSNEYSTGASYEITPVGKGANIPTCTLEGTNLTVTYSLPCAVAYSTDGGATYTRISATSASDGSYVYDLSAVPANAKIIVVVKGDVNGDGKVNSKDVTRLRQNIKSPATYPLDEGMTEAANVNGDSKVNGKDVTRLRQYIKSPNSYPLG